jgi:hypothetical protein
MKIAVWVVCLLLFGFWTGGTLLLTALTEWGARQLASGETAALGDALAQWPVPAWVLVWADAALIESAQGGVTWALQALDGALPLVGSAIGLVVPFIWVLWGLGVVLLLGLAFGSHFLLGRLQPALVRGV